MNSSRHTRAHAALRPIRNTLETLQIDLTVSQVAAGRKGRSHSPRQALCRYAHPGALERVAPARVPAKSQRKYHAPCPTRAARQITSTPSLGVELRSRALQAIPAKGAIIPLGLRYGLHRGVVAQLCPDAAPCQGDPVPHLKMNLRAVCKEISGGDFFWPIFFFCLFFWGVPGFSSFLGTGGQGHGAGDAPRGCGVETRGPSW